MLLQKVTTANPYIYQIRRSLQQTQPVAVDWLVIAHNDTQLLTQLDEAFPDSVLAVVALPQSHWQMHDEWMTEVVDWAVRELGVKGVLVVGHSHGEGPEDQVKLLGGKVKTHLKLGGASASGSPSLLDRIKQAQLHAARIQEQLAAQIDKLSRLTAVQSRMLCDQLQLHGLFYRAESGIFYAYDQQQRGFKPLLRETAVA